MDIKSIGMREGLINSTQTNQSIESNNPAPQQKSEDIAAIWNNNISKQKLEPPIQTKAIFVVDSDKHISIQILDEDGNVVKEIPPEEYREMARKLRDTVESLYDRWA